MGKKGAAYTLSVLLKLNDQFSGKLNKSIARLRAFKKEAASALGQHNKLVAGLNRNISVAGYSKIQKKYRDLSKDSRTLARDVTKVNSRLGRDINIGGLDRAVESARRLRRETRGISTNLRDVRGVGRAGGRNGGGGRAADPDDEILRPRPLRARRRGMFGSVEMADDTMQATRQSISTWRDRAESLKPYIDATTRLLRAQERFKVIGLPEEQNAQAFAAVKKTVGELRGTTYADTTENILDLVGALGDLNQSISMLPVASKYKLGYEVLFGDRMNPEALNEQVRASFKFLEYTGNTMRGPDQMAGMLDVITQIGNATGGRVTPEEILTMARRGKVATRDLSPEGLRNISTLIEDLGAPTTGTALMSLYQSLVSGIMPQYSAKEFERFGLVTGGDYTKAGMLKKIKPGGNVLGPLMQRDPLEAADRLVEALKSHGIDTNNEQLVRETLSRMFPNRNAFALMDALITQRPQIVKEAERAKQSKGGVATYEQVKGTDLLKIKEYEAALENFRAQAGGPMLKAATGLAQGLMPVADFFAQHPTVTKYAAGLIIAGKAGSSFVETISLFGRIPGVMSWFTRARTETDKLNDLIRSMPSTKTTKFGIDTSTVGRGVSRVKGAINGLPTSIKIGVAFTAAALGADLLYESYEAIQREAAARAGLGRATTQHVSSLGRLREQSGGRLPEDVAKTASAASFRSLNTGDDLLRSLEPNILKRGGLGSAYNKIYRGNPYNSMGAGWAGYSRENTVTQFKQRAPELGQFPEVMKQFIRDIERMKLSGQMAPESSREILKVAEMAFPDSYKQASQALTTELQNLNQQVTPLPALFGQFKEPLGRSPVAINSMNIAASNFASRVNSLQIVIPTMTYQGVPMPGAAAPGGVPTAPPASAIPRSALGSIVRGDGLAELHKGNVIFPARLSRQRPGDWLQQASQIKLSGRDTSRVDGGMFTDASANINYSPQLTIQGSVSGEQIALLRSELSRHRAELETMISRATNPRTVERQRKFREQINGERR